jgi:hypothetical protein
MISARSSSIGSPSYARKKVSVRKTHSFPSPRSRPATTSNFVQLASTGGIGRARTRYVESFGKPARSPACLVSTRIRFGIRSFNWHTVGKLDAERFKAWSQNLGHENCLTAFSSYGEIPPARQAEIIRGLAKSVDASDAESVQISCADWSINWSSAGTDFRIDIFCALPPLRQ